MESSTSNGSATKAPAKRSALACLPCRAAKNKCDGVPPPLALEISSSQALKANPSDDIPSDQPCTRCARLEAACMWQPSHRTGRPKKKRRGSSSPDENESNTLFQHQSSGQSWKEAAQPIQSQGQQPLSTATPQPVASTIDQTQVASFDLSDQDLIALLNSSPFDSGQVDGRQFLGEVYGSVASSSAQGMAQSAAASRPSPAGKNAGAQHQAYTPYDFSISSAPFCELESLALGAMPSRAELTPPLSRDRGSSARSPLSSSRAGDQLSMLRSRISSAFPSSKTEIADRGRTMGSAPSPGILARANEVSRNPEYEVGLRYYFHGVGHSLPLLGEEEAFMADFQTRAPMLLTAASTLGYLLQDGREAPMTASMRSLSRRSADELRTSPQRRFGADVGLILDWVRALILISYDSYGRNELKLADEYIRLACEIALGAGLNLVDSKGNFQDPSDASSVRSAKKFEGINLNPGLALGFKEDCRRAWWELYIAELMLFATTSGEVPRHFDDTSMSVLVNSPLDPGETNQSEAYDIRVRTAAIVNESIKPPADPCRPELSRLQAIDTMISNLLVRAQSTWAGLALETSQHSSGQPTPASQTKLEITFTAMVILHAARIHLHRQAWFSDLTMDFESCSFKPKNTPVKDLAPGSIEGQDEGCEDCSLSSPKAAIRRTRIAASVAKIVSSSDGILRLVRLDHDMGLDRALSRPSTSERSSKVPAHWPFFNCCQLVAAFGYVVAVAASGAEENGSFPMSTSAPTGGTNVFGSRGDESNIEAIVSSWISSPANEIDGASITSLAGSKNSSAMSDAGLQRRSESRQAAIWKLRAALSNIRFAEATLTRYSVYWPIAEVYREEVRRCRNAVDFSGPTGLGSPP